jgi:hypothetical protein
VGQRRDDSAIARQTQNAAMSARKEEAAMGDEWDKMEDSVQQEMQRRERMRRVHGKPPLANFIKQLVYWCLVLAVGILVVKFIL